MCDLPCLCVLLQTLLQSRELGLLAGSQSARGLLRSGGGRWCWRAVSCGGFRGCVRGGLQHDRGHCLLETRDARGQRCAAHGHARLREKISEI